MNFSGSGKKRKNFSGYFASIGIYFLGHFEKGKP